MSERQLGVSPRGLLGAPPACGGVGGVNNEAGIMPLPLYRAFLTAVAA